MPSRGRTRRSESPAKPDAVSPRRKKTKEKPRRRSLSLRGQRCSKSGALLQPHPDVPTAELYRHISPDLAGSERMRILLLWTGSRAAKAMGSKPLRDLQLAVLRGISNRSVSTSWVHSAQAPARDVPLRQHPENKSNRVRAQVLRDELERLSRQEADWTDLLASTFEEHARFFDQQPAPEEHPALLLRGLTEPELQLATATDPPRAPVLDTLAARIAACVVAGHRLRGTMEESARNDARQRSDLAAKLRALYPYVPGGLSVPLFVAFANASPDS